MGKAPSHIGLIVILGLLSMLTPFAIDMYLPAYMVASGFSFSGMFSFLSAGPFVYIDLYGVSPQHFGYYFALNVVFLFLTTYTNSRVVRRLGANQMFRIGLLIQFAVGIALVAIYALNLGFLPLVLGVAIYVGCTLW